MRQAEVLEAVLPSVLVPRSLLERPDAFGGRVRGDCLMGDLVVREGYAVGLHPSVSEPARLVMPRFAEPHVHLDKCHSIDRMDGIGGNLSAAIDAQRIDKSNWTYDDLRSRAVRGLSELMAAGCAVVRTHIDWSDDPAADAVPLAWDVLGELAVGTSSDVILQRAALTNVEALAARDYAMRCGERVARDGGVLGTFVFDQPNRRKGIENAFRAADHYGLALDFHVDEGLAPDLNGLGIIADVALDYGFSGSVLCGHACSLANLEADDLARIADKLARAGISIAALPQTNLYLQGRRHGTPERRGLTRVKELVSAGVNVVLGADNVRDAFCPIGQHAPLNTLSLAVLAAHLDPPFADHLPMISTHAAKAIGHDPLYVDTAAVGDLLVFDASSTSDLISCAPTPHSLVDSVGERVCPH